MSKRSVLGLILTACLLVGPAAVCADVIELKTGQRIEGTLKQATPMSVSVEVGGQTITFTGDKVRAIYFGTAPTKQQSTSQVPAKQQPDRFVAWKRELLPGSRPTVENMGVHETRVECNKFADHMNAAMKGAAKEHNSPIHYWCLPTGVQPTP